LLAIEEPLQFCLNGSPISITMRSPGSDLDIAVGCLFTEEIINDVRQILSMHVESGEDISGTSGDRVTMRLRLPMRQSGPQFRADVIYRRPIC
jgi:FdhD protein